MLLQQPTDEVGRVGVHALRVGHRALQHLAVGGEVVLRLEGRAPVEHLVEEHAQRPVVHLARFRGRVRVRATVRARVRVRDRVRARVRARVRVGAPSSPPPCRGPSRG
jgi:hypothetical protein